jgi:hypothetical protein
VVKRAAPAARKSRQEFPSRLGLGQHPAREGLRTTVSTARELKQATPELEERFTHSGCYERQCMIAELAMGDLSYRQIGQKYGRPRTMSSNLLGTTRRRSLRNGRGSTRN